MDAYTKRVDEQIRQYEPEGKVQQPIPGTHYYVWKHYIQERFTKVFGVADHIAFYVKPFAESILRTGNSNVVSIGSGEGNFEVQIAEGLISSGVKDFTIHCVELSPLLIDRAIVKARDAGLGDHFHFVNTDVRDWHPTEKLAGVMAHHSLHHIEPLEHLFTTIHRSLDKGGYFLTCDMIGRNGHMRWPEAHKLMDRLWAIMPPEKRFNNAFGPNGKQWDKFITLDCSARGFEGIRAQDILPLLTKIFHFDGFVAYGGLIEIFMDLQFGPNFTMTEPGDRAFIDLVAHLNETLIEAGHLSPTAMFAKMTVDPINPTRVHKHLTPEFCVRKPGALAA